MSYLSIYHPVNSKYCNLLSIFLSFALLGGFYSEGIYNHTLLYSCSGGVSTENSTHGLAYIWNSFIQDLNISQLLCVSSNPFLPYLVGISMVFCQVLSSLGFFMAVFSSKSFPIHKSVRLTPAPSRAPQ